MPENILNIKVERRKNKKMEIKERNEIKPTELSYL